MPSRAEKRFISAIKAATEAQNTGDVAKMQHHYQRALKFRNDPAVHVNLGVINTLTGNQARAKRHYQTAIKLDQSLSRAHLNLGVILRNEGDLDGAMKHYRLAARTREKEAFNNMSDVMCVRDNYAEALDFVGKALDIDPTYSDAFVNAGTALWGLGRYEEAEGALRKAIALKDNPKAHMYLGLLLMTLGRYQEGFPEYNWRFIANNWTFRGGDMTLWSGKEPPALPVYIWPEQGLGDEILHFGSAPHLSDFLEEKRVTWECDPRLVDLFKRSVPDNIRVVAKQEPPSLLPLTLLQIPAGSLSQLYAPWEPRAAYLKADPARVAEFRAMLPKDKRVVGLSWMSKNTEFGGKKSLDLGDMSAFLEDDSYHCVDLQYGEHEGHSRLHRVDGLDVTNDIDGLAALICACDLVVTVSNSTAHLAGALGVPTVVMVATGGGKLWYWGTDDKTDWYQSVRIQRFERSPP